MKNLHFTMQNRGMVDPPPYVSSQVNAYGCHVVRVQKLRHLIYRVHLRVSTRRYRREGFGYRTGSPNCPWGPASFILNRYLHSCPGDKGAETWNWLTQSRVKANNLLSYNSITPYASWASTRFYFIFNLFRFHSIQYMLVKTFWM
jgi:hypothetical protein